MEIFSFSAHCLHEDNVVRNDEYIARSFNIFNTRRGCGRGYNGTLDNDEKKGLVFCIPLGIFHCRSLPWCWIQH